MHRLRVYALMFGVMLLTGCMPNRIYRQGLNAVQTAPVVAGASTPSPFKLGIVEFDDMGESWEKCSSLTDPENCQLSRVVHLIRTEKQRTGEVVVVVFIHGWKNDASPGNEAKKNLRDFKLLMDRLSRNEASMSLHRQQSAGKPVAQRSYIGVYMAWRGQAVRGDVFGTFWNRRDAAQRVGSSDFAESLFRIMSATKENSPDSRVVVVGHSFGARVLETAITNTFISLLIPQPNANGQVGTPEDVSPADLIVYVNPATDSFRTKQMVELMKRTEFKVTRGADRQEPPLFLSVTSTGDAATGTAFPLGQDLSAPRKAFRGGYGDRSANVPSQKTFFTKTPGHIPFLFSHTVRPVDGPCLSKPDLLRFEARERCFELTPVPNRWNSTPFWVTTVPVIRDHVDIFNDGFVAMITGLLKQYEVLDSPQGTRMSRAR